MNLIVPWGERKALQRDEERHRLLDEYTQRSRRDPAVAEAVSSVLASSGEPSAYASVGGAHAAVLTPEQEQAFRANDRAWQFFQAEPPGSRQSAIFWVVSAKRDDTRARRLATLIDDSAHSRRIALRRRP